MTDLAQLPFYLRKYQLDIKIPGANGNTSVISIASDPSGAADLRFTFDIYQRAFQVYWYADITIWNLDEATTLQLLGANMQSLQVVVQAGYQNGSYGIVWSGPVFQPLFERVDAIDYKITLHCILGLLDLTRNFVNQTFAAEIQQIDLVTAIAKQSFSPIQISPDAQLSVLGDNKLPRAKTVFGSPAKHFDQIAQANDMQWWLSNKGLELGSFNSDTIPTTPDLTFAPPQLPLANTSGPAALASGADGVIVGTPVQTQYGVAIRVLLDARVQVSSTFMVIKIDNSQIRRQKLLLDPGQNGPAKLTLLDADGLYLVGGVRFLGDTRGQEWYCDIEGYSTYLAKQHLLQAIMSS